MPAAQRHVNIINAMCIAPISCSADTSYKETFPIVPLTTRVIIAIPEDCPVVLIVASMEFATANFAGGTQPIITFVFGDEKSAMPTPAIASAMITNINGVLFCMNTKNRSETAQNPIPSDASL